MEAKLCWIIFMLAPVTTVVAAADLTELSGKVLTVIDGNTIEFQSAENETFKFVLSGIDCPELNQEFGEEARVALEKIVLGKELLIVIEGKDRLGNKVGSIRFKGRDPRLDLLARGLAWTMEKDPDPSFEELKELAKKGGKGLWKQENPIAPWTFRRQQTMLLAKSS